MLFGLLYLPAVLLAAALGIFVATSQALAAQAATSVTVLVRDLEGEPLPDIAFTVVDAGDVEQVTVTDAKGKVEVSIVGASVWLREATGPDGSALEMDSNSIDGGLRLPLDGTPLVLGFMLDGPLLFRAPEVLDNPAFPEGELLEEPVTTAVGSAASSETSEAVAPSGAPAAPTETPAPASGFPLALILVLVAVTIALLLLLFVWLRQVRRYRDGLGRGQP
jgi:hypothetical protein